MDDGYRLLASVSSRDGEVSVRLVAVNPQNPAFSCTLVRMR